MDVTNEVKAFFRDEEGLTAVEHAIAQPRFPGRHHYCVTPTIK